MPSRRRRRRSPGADADASAVRRYEIIGNLDRRGVEALLLEIRRLARRYEVELKELRLEPGEDASLS